MATLTLEFIKEGVTHHQVWQESGGRQGAQLSLMGHSIVGLDMSDFYLAEVIITDCTFTNVTLRHANFGGAYLFGSTFTDCDLTGANFAKSDLQSATFTRCTLTDTRLVRADVWGATFQQSTLQNADLQGLPLFHTTLIACDMRGALLYQASLSDTTLHATDLRGAKNADAVECERAMVWQDGQFQRLEGDALRAWLLAEVAKG